MEAFVYNEDNLCLIPYSIECQRNCLTQCNVAQFLFFLKLTELHCSIQAGAYEGHNQVFLPIKNLNYLVLVLQMRG